MDDSHSVTDNIYPSIDGIINSIEKDLPASESTTSILEGDDEGNIAEYFKIIALSLPSGINCIIL